MYITKKEKTAYSDPIKYVTEMLAESGWETSHVSYVLWAIIIAWWEATISIRSVFEIQGVLTDLIGEFRSTFVEKYYDKKFRN